MGNDDIMAIYMLLLSKKFQIVGISCVNGVSNPIIGANNLRRIFEYCDEQIPICSDSIFSFESKNKFPKRDIIRAETLNLLNSLNIPSTTRQPILNKSVEKYIYKKVNKQIDIFLALGPLTNIAKTILRYKKSFTSRVKRLVIMGGGIYRGNVAPFNQAEYNIWVDPKAAKIVFDSGIPITLVGIDATAQVPVSEKFSNRVRLIRTTNPKSRILQEIIWNNDGDFNQFYDPLAAAVVIDSLVVAKKLQTNIDIAVEGKNEGKTKLTLKQPRNISVVLRVDRKRFYSLLISLLQKK